MVFEVWGLRKVRVGFRQGLSRIRPGRTGKICQRLPHEFALPGRRFRVPTCRGRGHLGGAVDSLVLDLGIAVQLPHPHDRQLCVAHLRHLCFDYKLF